MPITRSSIKTGPATVLYDSAVFHFKDGLTLTEEKSTFGIPVDTYGQVDERNQQTVVRISGTPAGEWEHLAVLWPWVGVDIGTRIHGDTDKALVIHCKDGTRYTYHNAAVTKMPDIDLSPIRTLIGGVEWTARVKDNTDPTAANSLFTRDSAAWSDTTFASANILTQKYLLSWGASPWDSFETQEGVRISFNLSLADIPLDNYGVIDQQVADLVVEARFKPLGIAQSAIDGKMALQGVAGAARGASLNSLGVDLDISGTGVFIRLRGAAPKMQTQEFGMAKVRSGEMNVVATRTFTSGVANALVYIGTSAPA